MRVKRKKILTRTVLAFLVLSIMLSTFSVFSSAAEDDSIDGVYGHSVPPFLYYEGGDDPDAYSSSLWPVQNVGEGSQIVFGLIGRNVLRDPWHIVPYVRGRDSFKTIVSSYNGLVAQKGYSGMANSYSRSDLVSSRIFQTSVIYNNGGDDCYNFGFQFTVKDPASWPYEWLPCYSIFFAAIDGEGNLSDSNPIYPGIFDTSDSLGTIPVVSQGLVKYSMEETNLYTYIDVGAIFDQVSYGEDVKGIQIKIYEMFYKNNSIGYPSYVGSSSYNLYSEAYIGGFPLTSYGFNYTYVGTGFQVNNAFNEGFEEGSSVGFNNGYNLGRSDQAAEDSNYNAVDGIIALAQVPGAFISGMLDFDLFGVNLAGSVKAIFTVLVIAFIIVILLRFLL